VKIGAMSKDEISGRRTSNRFTDEQLLAIQKAATVSGIAGPRAIQRFNRQAIAEKVQAVGIKWPDN